MVQENKEGGVDQSSVNKKSFDFSKLIADSHLTKEEKQIITETYTKDREALFLATK